MPSPMTGEETPQSPNRQRQFLFESAADATEGPLKAQSFVFDSEIFYRPDFDLDAFIREQKRKAPMEKLRDDLVAYHRVLTNSLIELINQDYADFVNLSTNLVGVDRALSSIQQPVTQLRDQIALVLRLIEDALSDVGQHLRERQQAARKESNRAAVSASLSLVAKLELWLGQAEVDNLERCCRAFVRLQHLCQRCRGNQSIDSLGQRVSTIGDSLQQRLSDSLTSSLLSNDKVAIRSSLAAYSAIGKPDSALDIYRELVVSSFLVKAVGQEALSCQDSLSEAYSMVVNFANEQRQHWSAILDSTLAGQYDFLVDALFPECVRHLGERLPMLFNPGNPAKFHQRYTITMERFLGKFYEILADERRIARLKAHPAHSELCSKFNLAVYFQIRLHEVTTALDESLARPDSPDSTTVAGADGCRLRDCNAVLDSLRRLWSDEVFLAELAARLWKLSLQIICRFGGHLEGRAAQLAERMEDEKEEARNDEGADEGVGRGIRECLTVLEDVERLRQLTLRHYDECIRPRLPTDQADSESTLLPGLCECLGRWRPACDRVRQLVTDSTVARSLRSAKQVSEVPRAYRKTNRPAPEQPSAYARNLMSPTFALLDNGPNQLALIGHKENSEESVAEWLAAWISRVLPQYRIGMSDVLSSVKKMEESLRLLKKKKAVSQGWTDDDKIREQLLIDAKFVRAACLERPGGDRLPQAAEEALDALVETAESAKAAAKHAAEA